MQSINYYIACPDYMSAAIDAMNAQKKENLSKHIMEYVIFGTHVSTKYPPMVELVTRIDANFTVKQCYKLISALIDLSQSAPTIG